MKNHRKSLLLPIVIAVNLLFIYMPNFAGSCYGTANEVIYAGFETIQKNHFNQDEPPKQDDPNKKDDANQSDGKVH